MTWHTAMLPVFDCETTGTNPREARIVQAAYHYVKPDATLHRASATWLVNPGIPVPDDAAKVHGITTERLEAEGEPWLHALPAILEHFAHAAAKGWPVAIYNAPYDWTIIQAEARRLGCRTVPAPYFIDPLLLDRKFDRYRKGSRQLKDVAMHYGFKWSASAHDAGMDALATAHVARTLAERNPRLAELPIAALHQHQVEWYEEWKVSFNAYQEKRDAKDRAAGKEPRGFRATETWPC